MALERPLGKRTATGTSTAAAKLTAGVVKTDSIAWLTCESNSLLWVL
jgi:hypothetical protein